MAEWDFQFRVLQADDDRKNFCCGSIELDRFFRQFAGQNQFRHHIGVTYVLADHSRIAGFVTVSAGEMVAETLPANVRRCLPEYPLPIMRIARLAVDTQFQGLGLGKRLLRASLQLALEMKALYGCVGVVVDAKPESLAFYKKIGFMPLQVEAGGLGNRPEPQALFLAIKTIELAMNAS